MIHHCPECAKEGITKTYKKATGLGVHRRYVHKILGTSSTSVRAREDKDVKHAAVCFYCNRSFRNVNGRSKHITASHPGKSHDGLNGMVKPMRATRAKNQPQPVEWQERVLDKMLVAYTVGQLITHCQYSAKFNGLPEKEFAQQVAEYFTKVANK